MKVKFSFKKVLFWIALMAGSVSAYTQTASGEVVLSGARFTNDLFQHWISDYQKLYPAAHFRIENKGAAEYSVADIIVHAQELDKTEIDKSRKYLTIARYAVLPVANAQSSFAAVYGERGLTREEIKQVFFFDPLSSGSKKPLKATFNVYTRVQQAPAPVVFARNFGYEQQDLHGRAIAGADIHLIKSVQKDTTGVTYAPLGLIFTPGSGQILAGLKIIPVDFDDNGKVQDDERFYDSLPQILTKLGESSSKNIPVADIRISVNATTPNAETVRFIAWVLDHGLKDLAAYGYLPADEKSFEKERSGFAVTP